MKKLTILTFALFLGTAMTYASEGKTQSFKVDNAKSKVDWIGSKPGGQHNGTVDVTEGAVQYKDGVLTGGKFTIDLRTIVNFDVESPEWNKKLVDHLKSEDFFYVEKHPVAVFEITKAEAKGNSEYRITGVLTMKEVSKTISFNAKLSQEGDMLTATSDEIVLDRTQWKVEAMSKSIFADLKDNYVDDEMKVKVKLVAKVK